MIVLLLDQKTISASNSNLARTHIFLAGHSLFLGGQRFSGVVTGECAPGMQGLYLSLKKGTRTKELLGNLWGTKIFHCKQ